MINLFYQVLVYLSRKWGVWVLHTAVWIVAAGFFFCFPQRVATSARFYRAVFPHRPGWYPFWCAWRQFHNFTAIYIDRYTLETSGSIDYTAEGLEHVMKAARRRTGGILLMSHVGNWEVAAHLLRKMGIPLILFMGQKTGEQLEGLQKNTLRKNGVEIIANRVGQGSPMDILEGLRRLRDGWILSIAGDRFGDSGRSFVETRFMGHWVRLPETPFALALATGVPVFVFFAFRTGTHGYHFVAHPPMFLRATSREGRKDRIREAAQQYARLLEQSIYRHPFEWHHFEPFLGPTARPGDHKDQGA